MVALYASDGVGRLDQSDLNSQACRWAEAEPWGNSPGRGTQPGYGAQPAVRAEACLPIPSMPTVCSIVLLSRGPACCSSPSCSSPGMGHRTGQLTMNTLFILKWDSICGCQMLPCSVYIPDCFGTLLCVLANTRT